jgi:hypothetical protein
MANSIPLVLADGEFQISSAIGVGATSFTLASATDDDGNAVAAGKYCFTIDNGKSNKEYLLGQLNGTNVTSVVSVSRTGVETSGAARKHRIGASAIITDFAAIQRVVDILRGQIALDGANPVGYDAEPTLADRKELATVGYVLDTATGGTVAFDSQTTTGTAGEDVVAGDLIYFKTSDQEWYKTDADTAATVEGVQLGIALGAGSDGDAISGGIQISGTYTTSGLTAGATYYASNTAGAISATAGTVSAPIGVALSTTKLLLALPNLSVRYASTSSGASDENKVAKLNADGQIPHGFLSSIPGDVQDFSASGTWTKPAKGNFAIVELWGAGGSGGAAKYATANIASAGGGGGAYAKFIIPLSELSATETVTIGVGGVARVVSSETRTNGASGALSSFKDSAVFFASGGVGGGTDAVASGTTSTVAGAGGTLNTILALSQAGANGGSAAGDGTQNPPVNNGGNARYAGAGAGSAACTGNGPTSKSSVGGTSTILASTGGNGSATTGTGGATATAGGIACGGGGVAIRNASGTATSGAGGDGYARITVF